MTSAVQSCSKAITELRSYQQVLKLALLIYFTPCPPCRNLGTRQVLHASLQTWGSMKVWAWVGTMNIAFLFLSAISVRMFEFMETHIGRWKTDLYTKVLRHLAQILRWFEKNNKERLTSTWHEAAQTTGRKRLDAIAPPLWKCRRRYGVLWKWQGLNAEDTTASFS